MNYRFKKIWHSDGLIMGALSGYFKRQKLLFPGLSIEMLASIVFASSSPTRIEGCAKVSATHVRNLK